MVREEFADLRHYLGRIANAAKTRHAFYATYEAGRQRRADGHSDNVPRYHLSSQRYGTDGSKGFGSMAVRHHIKVLVIDDDPSICKTVGLLLEDHGYTPRTFTDADEPSR